MDSLIIKNLIESFKKLPSIGDKSAERIVFSLLEFTSDDITNFSNNLLAFRDKIGRCEICNNITFDNNCEICTDLDRNKSKILVVEKPKDVVSFERIGNYNGLYHVLGGVISPYSGIGPNDLSIEALIKRIDIDNVNEVILALKPNIEGETTMQYIGNILLKTGIKVTKIATGIPVGADIDYLDQMTLELAFEERKSISWDNVILICYKIIYCFLMLYVINVIIAPLNVMIPINIFTLLIIYLFDVFGLGFLILILFLLL